MDWITNGNHEKLLVFVVKIYTKFIITFPILYNIMNTVPIPYVNSLKMCYEHSIYYEIAGETFQIVRKINLKILPDITIFNFYILYTT